MTNCMATRVRDAGAADPKDQGSSVQVRSGAPARMPPPTTHAVSNALETVMRIALIKLPPSFRFLRSTACVAPRTRLIDRKIASPAKARKRQSHVGIEPIAPTPSLNRRTPES